MAAGVNVRKLETKSHDKPDEVRTPSKTRVEIVRLEGFTIGRFIFQPGWRWSECVKPAVGTESCQVGHVGHAVSGRITVQMKDGSKIAIGPGMSYTIPPGHDAWVEGNEPFVGIEVMSAEEYAKLRKRSNPRNVALGHLHGFDHAPASSAFGLIATGLPLYGTDGAL